MKLAKIILESVWYIAYLNFPFLLKLFFNNWCNYLIFMYEISKCLEWIAIYSYEKNYSNLFENSSDFGNNMGQLFMKHPVYSKQSWRSDIEYDLLGNSSSSFHVGDEILNLLFLYDFFILFDVYYKLKFDKGIYIALPFKFILAVRLSNSLWGLDVLLFVKFINIVFVFELYLYWIHYIVIYFFSNLFCSMQRIYDLSDFI